MGFYFGFMRERERGSEFGLEFSVILLDSRKSSGVVERGSVGHKGIKKHFFKNTCYSTILSIILTLELYCSIIVKKFVIVEFSIV